MSKYRVVTEASVELQWNPDEDLKQLLEEFNESIFHMDDLEALEVWICGYLSRFPDTTFIEGIGKVAPEGGVFGPDTSDAVLTYCFSYEDISVENDN